MGNTNSPSAQDKSKDAKPKVARRPTPAAQSSCPSGPELKTPESPRLKKPRSFFAGQRERILVHVVGLSEKEQEDVRSRLNDWVQQQTEAKAFWRPVHILDLDTLPQSDQATSAKRAQAAIEEALGKNVQSDLLVYGTTYHWQHGESAKNSFVPVNAKGVYINTSIADLVKQRLEKQVLDHLPSKDEGKIDLDIQFSAKTVREQAAEAHALFVDQAHYVPLTADQAVEHVQKLLDLKG